VNFVDNSQRPIPLPIQLFACAGTDPAASRIKPLLTILRALPIRFRGGGESLRKAAEKSGFLPVTGRNPDSDEL